jgi:hypothetical protein
VLPQVMVGGQGCGRHAFASPSPHTPGVPPPPQEVPGAHVPHDAIVPPHPLPVGPHVTVGGHTPGVHPLVQTPPEHVSAIGHVPHGIEPPHPSGQTPHTTPAGHAVRGTQVTQLPPMHDAPLAHVPQFAVRPPQPSAWTPQVAPSDPQVAGVQLGAPHLPGVPPPPQLSGGVQLPQSTSPPHPFPVLPHVMVGGQACGTHAFASPSPQVLGTPPPPHVVPAAHVPHDAIVPPHPSPVGPQVTLGGHGCFLQPVEQVPAMQVVVGSVQVPQLIEPPHPSG